MSPHTQLGPSRGREAGAVCACFNLRKAARAITQLYDDLLRPSGLRTTQFTLLMAIRSAEKVTVKELADRVVMDPSTLTRNLKLLEKEGLIRVRPGVDRRVREVTLTPRGARALAKAYPLWKEAQAKVARGMGRNRLSRLLSDLSASVAVARSA